MEEFFSENASAVFTIGGIILGGLISGIFAFLTMWFQSRREEQFRLAGKLMDRRIDAHEAVLRFCGTMREMAGTDTFDEQGEVVRFPRVFVSRESFYHWYENSYHQLRMDSGTWFSTDVTREMNLLQDYLYTLHIDITNAPPDAFPTIGAFIRQDFIDSSANLERLAREYLSRDLLKFRLVNPNEWHKYQPNDTHRRLNQTAFMLHRKSIQQVADYKE